MKMVQLGQIAELGSGGTPKRSVSEYFGDGTPWVSIADLNDGIVQHAKESLTAAGVANSSAKIVPPGTLLVAMYGSIGKLGIAGTTLCTSQAIAFVRPLDEMVERRYLFHYLLSQRCHLQALGRGGTQMNIGQGDLKAWPVPLPSLAEQRRIAAILDQADTLRTKRRQGSTPLDELAQSIFFDMFGAPDRQATAPVAKFCTRITVGVVIKPASYYVDKGVPALRTLNVKPGAIDESELVYFSDEANNGPLAKSRLRTGDLVISRTGRAGVAALVPRHLDGANAIDLIVVTPDSDRADGLYLEALLNSAVGKRLVLGEQRGQIQQHFNVGSLRNAELPFPPIEEQREFAKRIRQLRTLSASRDQQALELDSLFASLQARAFRGEL